MQISNKYAIPIIEAILLDPQAPTYYQACAMIDKMCELQKDILPKLAWQ